ncbi:dihydropteroate synthase [Tistrella mobilis]|uniref:dihydropteroate synthase n=1 Tax=Tistrella mobilis TaxID=171437 RepID=UPI0035583F62
MAHDLPANAAAASSDAAAAASLETRIREGDAGLRLYARPFGFAPVVVTPGAGLLKPAMRLPGPGFRRLAGGWLAFDMVELLWRGGEGRPGRVVLPVEAALRLADRVMEYPGGRRLARRLRALEAPRQRFAGLDLQRRARVMAIVNVTPDSFSDGGDAFAPADAAAAVRRALADGADLLDLGAESTRPGAADIDPAEEIRRLDPALDEASAAGAVVSVDTRKGAVMRHAAGRGAAIANDVSGFTYDPAAAGVVAQTGLSAVAMHMRGTPDTMQQLTGYDDVVLDVFDEIEDRLVLLDEAGVSPGQVAVDPGIGFSKTVDQNLALLHNLSIFHGLGRPLLIGVSRKSFIGRITGEEAPRARVPGSLAAALLAVGQGAQIVRVHDVAETVQALVVGQAIGRGRA